MRAVLGGTLAACTLASPGRAQPSSPGGTWNGLPDRFRIDTGYFRLAADTNVRFNGAPGAGDIDLEDDLGVDDGVDTFSVDATWRVGRRRQLKLGCTRLSREIAYQGFQVFPSFRFLREVSPHHPYKEESR